MLALFSRLALEERIEMEESTADTVKYNASYGAKEMTFVPEMVSL
mgnify:CR=1 FL=1